jgi:hypothetical protein
MATLKTSIRADINILWKVPEYRPAFVKTTKGTPTLREQIMPTLQTFTEFVHGLKGLARSRPFSLQIHGQSDNGEDDFVRVLRASYQPVMENASGTADRTVEKESLIQYEVKQDAIDKVFTEVILWNRTKDATTILDIPVPVDKDQRAAFLKKHDLQWDEVDWNDGETATGESARHEDVDSVASHRSFTEAGAAAQDLVKGDRGDAPDSIHDSLADGPHVEESEGDSANQAHSNAIGEGNTSATNDSCTVPFTIVSVSVPGDVDEHEDWLKRHGFGADSAVWADFQANEGDRFGGIGIEMSVCNRENVLFTTTDYRHSDPFQELHEFHQQAALSELGWIEEERP